MTLMKPALVLFLLLAAALAVFLATFDADRYRPLLTERLQSVLGQPVGMERVSLGWRRGIALRLDGLKIYPQEEKTEPAPLDHGLTGRPALEAQSVQAVLSLSPLLRRQVQVASVFVSGLRAQVMRSPEGTVEVAGFSPKSPSAPAGAGGPPALRAARPGGREAGVLPLLIERIQVLDSHLEFTDRSRDPPLNIAVSRLNLLARVARDRLELKSLTGDVGGGRFFLRGSVLSFLVHPQVDVELEVENLALEAFLPPAPEGLRPYGPLGPEGQPQFRGRLFGSLKVRSEDGRLFGQGTVRIEDARVENLNVLREVFSRLTILPGLTETLVARLPESYSAKLQQRDTRFEPIEARLKADGERVSWDGLRIAGELFQIRGSGQMDRNGALTFPAEIRLEPELSAAAIRSVEELRFLADDQGALTLPVRLQGTLPQISVLPDVGSVARRLMASKGQELLGSLLEDLFEKKGERVNRGAQ